MRFQRACLALVLAATSSIAAVAADTSVREIRIDLATVQKDLSSSYLGADAEDFACGVDFNWLLTEGRDEFAQFCRETGTRVLRLANMSRYSVRGELATRKMRARKYAKDTNEALYTSVCNTPLDWWFDPKQFYDFCRENKIRVIPMINAQTYYDDRTDEAHYIINQPEHYEAAAKEGARQVQWIKDHGYLDLIVGWEVGNECYMRWNPDEYAAYLRHVIDAVRAVDPNIKLGVPIFICKPDDPDVLQRQGQDVLDQWLIWTRQMFGALGRDAQHLTYGVTHLYGAARSWNTNYRGIKDHDQLVQSIPNARHLELINTEWRHTSGDDQAGHRRFDIGGLWNTKFALTLMAYPRMQYTGLHSFLWFGGLGYWSNGEVWWQRPEPKERQAFIPDPKKRRRLALGPFAEPMRMCNTLIDTHPLMLQHHADLGEYSSALYYESRKHGDLQWLIATDQQRSSLAAIFVNTKPQSEVMRLQPSRERQLTGEVTVEIYTCDPDKLDWLAPPEATDHWRVQVVQQPADEPITLPTNSVVKVIVGMQ